MNFKNIVANQILEVLNKQFDLDISSLELQITRDEFKGDYTLVVFPFVRQFKQKPEEVAHTIGKQLLALDLFNDYNAVKGFLNLSISDSFWLKMLADFNPTFEDTKVHSMVEFSSPNTNKPLHLGHVRNNLLGNAVANILHESGNKVTKTQIINDRGIHICKSMVAWQKFGENETPESAGLKGDHFVGKYYVLFDKEYQKQIKSLIESGIAEKEAKQQAPIFVEAKEMLKKWEANDDEIRSIWKKMNAWVYKGFEDTYSRMGIEFDTIQYESNTYLLGKDVIQKGLIDEVFYQKEDGSVWIDLSSDGLDEKLVLRADGTSVYMTQDLGTAIERFNTFDLNQLIYVVGNEQDYHFKVLFLILEKLGYDWAKHLEHLSYGMVDLPHGKMKSREGTVVDADELMQEMHETAKDIAQEAGKLEGLSENEQKDLFEVIGLGALKYHILKVDPKKTILFDPKESIDFNGNTGPFLQYAYVRIQSVLKKFDSEIKLPNNIQLNDIERKLLRQLNEYHDVIPKAAAELNPALIANYTYDLVKMFNSFYQNNSILNAENDEDKHKRLYISLKVGEMIQKSLSLLGIGVPERM